MSFGGGDIQRRAEILLKIGVEGTEAADKLILQQDLLAKGLENNQKMFESGRRTAIAYLSELKKQGGQYVEIEKFLAAMTAAREAATNAEIKAAEEGARIAANEERRLEREAAAADKLAEQKEAALAKEIQAEIDAAQKAEQIAEQKAEAKIQAEIKAAEAAAKAAERDERRLDREAAAAAKLAGQKEAALVKEIQAEIKEAQKAEEITAKRVEVEMEVEAQIAAVRQKAVQAAVEQQMKLEAIRRANAKAGQLEAEATQHWADVLQMGRQQEIQQKRAVTSEDIANQERLQKTILQTNKFIERGAEVQNEGTPKANKFGYAILNISHAFQDLQYGVGAVLNNIPLIITSLGGGPGLAGTVMAASVAVQIFRENVGDLGAMLGISLDPATKFANTIEEAKAKIAAIEGKTFKFAVDYSSLEDAKKQLEEMVKLKNLVEGTKETSAQKKLSEEIKKLTTEQGGGSGMLEKAVVAEQRGFKIGDAIDYEKVKNANKAIQGAIARQAKEDAEGWMDPVSRFMRKAATDTLVFETTRQRDAAQQRIDQAKKEYVQQQVGKFLEGDPRAIQAMRARAAKIPGQFTPEFIEGLKDIPGSPEEMEKRTKDRAAIDDLIEQNADESDMRRKMMLNKFKRTDKEAKDDFDEANDEFNYLKRKAGKATTARQQQINREASTFGAKFTQQSGLEDAMLRRAARGADMTTGLAEQVQNRIGDAVPRDIAREVADKIVADARQRMEAEIAGQGDLGAQGALTVRQEKAVDFDWAQQRKRQAEDAAGQKQMLDQQGAFMFDAIAQQAGGRLGQAGVMEATNRAVNEFKQHGDVQRAMATAIMQTMNDFANDLQGLRQFNMGMANGFGAMGARVGRQRAKRQGLAPAFPQF